MYIGSSEATPPHGSHYHKTTNPNARKDHDVSQPEIQKQRGVKELTKVYSVSLYQKNLILALVRYTYVCMVQTS